MSQTANSLDLLEHEDHVLVELFAKVRHHRGQGVEDRYEYGNAAKQIIRHIAVRQACLLDVSRTIGAAPSLAPYGSRMNQRAIERREVLDVLGHLSRSIQGIYLNTGQDFDGPMTTLMERVESEIRWELNDAIPSIRSVAAEGALPQFKSERYIRHHAPTRLRPSGPSWRERNAVASRVVTMIDHLRDHPRAAPGERIP